MKRYALSFALILAVQLHGSPSCDWQTGGVANELDSSGNWSCGNIPNSGSSTIFGTLGSLTPTLASTQTFGGISFSVGADAFTFAFLSGGHLTIPNGNDGAISNSSTALQTFNIDSGGSLTFDNGSYAASSGGNLIYNVATGGTLTFGTGNTISGTTVNASGGTVTLTSAFALPSSATFTVSGGGSIALGGILTVNAGTLSLTSTGTLTGGGGLDLINGSNVAFDPAGVANYSGGTTINNGTSLSGSVNNLQGTLVNNGTLTFNQATDASFSATVTGNGSLVKAGAGNLTLTGGVSGFTGLATITDGALTMDTVFGGSVLATGTGFLQGLGVVQGNVTIASGGTLALVTPTDSITIQGSYTQESGGTYSTVINGLGQAGLLSVGGPIILDNGSILIVNSADGVLNQSVYYLIATGSSVSGKFTQVSSNNPLFFPTVTYNGTEILIGFQPTVVGLADAGGTFNERQVAKQIDTLFVAATPAQQAVLSALLAGSNPSVLAALNQMTGQQYATLLLSAEIENEQVLRQLYGRLRGIMANPCRECRCVSKPAVWTQFSGGHEHYNGNSNANGMNLNDFIVSAGAEAQVGCRWHVGGSLSYARENISYKVVGGRGHSNGGIVGFYSVYRPCSYYLFGDLALGYNRESVSRLIEIGAVRYRPKGKANIFQGTAYLESGGDLNFKPVLIQPFLGFEGGYYTNGRVSESTGTPLNMLVHGRSYGAAYSRVGAHITFGCLPHDFSLGIDGAWQRRLTAAHNHIKLRFKEFGDLFPIHGFHLTKNIFDGDFFVANTSSCGGGYIQGGVQVANNAIGYEGILGLHLTW